MSEETKFTPGELHVAGPSISGFFVDGPENQNTGNLGRSSVCETFGPDAKGNAERIVRVWNSHDDLYAACKAWADYFDELDKHSDPFDRLAVERRKFHKSRMDATRDALTKAGVLRSELVQET